MSAIPEAFAPDGAASALWRLLGSQAGKAGVDITASGAYYRAKAIMEGVRKEQPHISWEEFAIEALKRWKIEMCTMVLEHGRA